MSTKEETTIQDVEFDVKETSNDDGKNDDTKEGPKMRREFDDDKNNGDDSIHDPRQQTLARYIRIDTTNPLEHRCGNPPIT